MSSPTLFDRIWETSTTTGTGTVSLDGAQSGYKAFSIIADGTTVPYVITNGSEFEVGEGVYSSSTLSRITVFSSSNSDALVNFSSGTKDVILAVSANHLTKINVEDSFISAEPISGGRAVNINSSGAVQIAMALTATRTPAIGIVVDNVASGLTTRIYNRGKVNSTIFNFSGYIGKPIWLGNSGELIVSGGPTASGKINQPIGTVTSHSGVFLGSIALISGQILNNSFASGQIESRHLGAAAVQSVNIASEAILSGSIASGQIGTNHFASGAVQSGNIASGQIGTNHIAAAAVQSGHIASGQIGTFKFASGAVQSGNIASGQIGTYKFSSGATITRTQFSSPLVSGTPWALITSEIISGTRAVSISSSGTLQIAMASVSTRMPAIGVVVENVASGISANVYTLGTFQTTSGMSDYSGYLGKAVYVGRSGCVVSTSGSFNSGGHLSGDIYQRIGAIFNSGGVIVQLSEAFKLASG